MFYGLLAAIGWGTSTTTAAIALRRARSHIVVLFSQAIGVVFLVILAVGTHAPLLSVAGSAVVALVWAGLIGLLSYLAFYQAVAIGSPGLMSAISSTYGGVAAILAVVLLGERLTGLGIAGVVLAVIGIVLAAAGPGTPAPAAAAPTGPGAAVSGRVRSGSPALAVSLALLSAVGYGVGGYLLGEYSQRSGWLMPGVIAHGTSVLALAGVLPLLRGRNGWRGLDLATLGWMAVAGLADAAALAAYSRGTQIGQVAITAAISSIYPVIPLAFGVLLLGERLSRRQLAGIVIIIAGLVLLGMA
ncbi:MAG: DMT family transporter [Actinomycetota bacterium]|nr:DMT family transporter [Actinomycetota bacterium]